MHFVDRFTAAHFLIGVVYGVFNLSFILALILSIAWELIENPLKAKFPSLFPHATADTWKNALGDIVAVLLGWWIASK